MTSSLLLFCVGSFCRCFCTWRCAFSAWAGRWRMSRTCWAWLKAWTCCCDRNVENHRTINGSTNLWILIKNLSTTRNLILVQLGTCIIVVIFNITTWNIFTVQGLHCCWNCQACYIRHTDGLRCCHTELDLSLRIFRIKGLILTRALWQDFTFIGTIIFNILNINLIFRYPIIWG